MRRIVKIGDLRQGMYVCELDRPWRETPFLFQGFEITSQGELDLLEQYCAYVYVESDLSTVAPPPERAEESARTAPSTTKRPVASTPQLRVLESKTPTGGRPQSTHRQTTTLDEEAEIVRATHEEATALIHSVMEDVHLGKSIDTEGARKVVAGMAASVLRNPDALACFTHLKKRDDYTALHCLRVSILALVFGRHLGLNEDELNLLGIGGLLHDIGKMRVPDGILNKPGKLTEREFEIMKSHVPLGVEILQRTKSVAAKSIEVTRQHHERYSGVGYMSQLKGEQITQFGMIAAIVDVYDAITSDRIYQEGISALDALKRMYEWRGRDFHPKLVEQFIQCIGIFPIGSVVVLNTDEIGVVRTLNREQRLKPQVVLVLKPDKTRYGALRAVDLARDTTPTGKAYEIAKVIAPGQYGVQPVHYLPVAKRV
jgi:putative nucleotidyltransferase with HDIG domain